MKSALLLVILVAGVSPGSADPYRSYQDSDQARSGGASSINCDTVRTYVEQVGLVQARVLARAAGMTASQEWSARRCLAKKD
jgi:hypothetical protein